jgi:hypothetical protein
VVEAGAKNSKTRTKYDTDTASFWALGSGAGGASSNSISGAYLDIAQKVGSCDVQPEKVGFNQPGGSPVKYGQPDATSLISCHSIKANFTSCNHF